jgi:type II secretory pathway pseudopilin PulG
MTERASEAGYSLLEVIVCVGLLILGSVLALALLPALARASQAQLMRGAATAVARNALERARAAAAYYPPAAVADPVARAAATSGHDWAFVPAASYMAAARVHRGLCGTAAATSDVPMRVTMSYDAPSDALNVAVSYPPNPCNASVQSTISLSAQLAPAGYAPQTQLPTAIADPALQ